MMSDAGSSSEDEGDLFARLESDDLFAESAAQLAKRQEAQRFVAQYARRDWGLAARQQRAAGGGGGFGDEEHVSESDVELYRGKCVRFLEKQGQQAKVWDCALVLAKFLTTPAYFPTGFFVGKRVIELGCGIGVPGLSTAVLGAREVVLTDLPMAVPWIRANIDANRASFGPGTSCVAQALMWGEPEAQDEAVSATEGPFDVILCSDLVYGERSIAQKLVWTLRALSHAQSLVVSVHEARFAGDRGTSFFELLASEGFSVSAVPMDALDAVYRADGIHVHLISPPAAPPS